MPKHALLLLTLCLLSLGTFAQKTFRVIGKPEMRIKSSAPKDTPPRLEEGDTFHVKPYVMNFAEIEEHFVYELICKDSLISVVPNEEHPGWYKVTGSGGKRTVRLVFNVHTTTNTVVKHAIPKVRGEDVVTENGKWIYNNLEWWDYDYPASERIHMDDVILRFTPATP